MRIDISTSFKKSLESMVVISVIDAPKTFRIPISLIRWLAVNAERPNKPRQLIIIEEWKCGERSPNCVFFNEVNIASKKY